MVFQEPRRFSHPLAMAEHKICYFFELLIHVVLSYFFLSEREDSFSLTTYAPKYYQVVLKVDFSSCLILYRECSEPDLSAVSTSSQIL